MKQLSFDALQVAALYELYVSTVLDGLVSIPADDLAARIGHGCTKGYLLVALNELETKGLLRFNSATANRNSSILPDGIRFVEKGLADPNTAFSKMRDGREAYIDERVVTVRTAPAADRIVRLDHNSEPVQSIIDATGDLQQKIRLGNDLGDLNEEEAAAALNEVEQIEQAMKSEFLRPEQFFSFARKSLKWIGEKAAGAAVGKAALALLTLIATFFGFGA